MAQPPSDYLIIQCHGGGFVSQTSRTHEVIKAALHQRKEIECIEINVKCISTLLQEIQNVNRRHG